MMIQYGILILFLLALFACILWGFSVIWALLQSPDLAITEAAVGAGVTGILFLTTLKKIHALKGTKDE